MRKNIEQFSDQFKKIRGVDDVVYDYKTVIRILNLLKSFRSVIYILSFTLILLSIYLVYSNNKIQMFGNRNLYFTMKLVGAQIKTMKIPIILNGLLIGMISSLFTLLFYNVSLILLTKVFNNIKFIIQVQIVDFFNPGDWYLIGIYRKFYIFIKDISIAEER